MAEIANLFNDLPEQGAGELFTALINARNVRIERIVSLGHTTPEGSWYDQTQNEWIVVLKGAARIRFENDEHPVHMNAGDCLNIPAHARHRVEWTTPTEPTIWLAVHYSVE